MLAGAIIFDIDGTLLDSVDFHAAAWQEATEQYGKPIALSAIRWQIGKGADQLMSVFLLEQEIANFGDDLEELRVRIFKDKYLPKCQSFLWRPRVVSSLASSECQGNQNHNRSSEMSSMKKSPEAPKKWSAGVTTSSTRPPEGLFTENAETIARSLASKKVSPRGPVSGLRMLTFYINRAGKELTESRRKELEKAKALLSDRIYRQKNKASTGRN